LKRLFFLYLLLLFAGACHSQSRWFASAGIGPINYWGDLQDKRLTTTGMQLSGAVGISYQASPHFLGNFNLTAGKLNAFDRNNGPKWRYRNLDFQSSLFEASFTAEYDLINITEPDDGNFIDDNPKKFTPYIFAGFGFFHFDPYTHDQSGKKVYLQPIGTEAQPTPYPLWQVSLPYGIGIKYAVSDNFLVSAEFNLRKTFTDYIDDVSQHQYPDTVQLLITHGQEAASLSYRADEIPNNKYRPWGYRGNPERKDGYYSFLFKASIQIFNKRSKFYYGY